MPFYICETRNIPSLKQQCQALRVLGDFFLLAHEKSKSPKSIALFILFIGEVFNKCKKGKNIYSATLESMSYCWVIYIMH